MIFIKVLDNINNGDLFFNIIDFIKVLDNMNLVVYDF